MNFYDDRVLPHLTDWAMRDSITGRYRAPVCGGALGTVVEFGFGSGANLAHYTDSVDRVLAVEPSGLSWQMSKDARAAFGAPVELVSRDAALLDLPDDSVDVVVSTWTLCTIPDLDQALSEARRVLRPGAQMRVVEHTIPDTAFGQSLARTVQPLWGRLAGGCHVDRDLAALIAASGAHFAPLPSDRFLTGTLTWD